MSKKETEKSIKIFVQDVLKDRDAWTPAWEVKHHESATVYAKEFAEQLAYRMGIDLDNPIYAVTVENIMASLAEEFRTAGCKVIWEGDVIKIFRPLQQILKVV
ncbi:hypothetical protein [Anaerocellum danielii]|uniref:Aminopeptidase n=1 Tax=Anaerocellum danielii TaxID=1387557 RepID=A0ABZ0TXF3_9FIRM|nr:hypothetical protein [Caldicellulosiruptor danielii]WPX08124.1 hypothetical protein SOJ16_001988 [Caldicellulosiruptor danielii]